MRIGATLKERALLIGIRRPKTTHSQMEASLAELARLVDTAGGEVVCVERQELKAITPATFIGSGKLQVIKETALTNGVQLVVFDDELSPAQNRNLSDELGLKVLDRTAVILDIFAKRARTREGELQVELAQLVYRSSRLTGKGMSFMQQAGYIGNRGPGETKLEVDKRRIRDRISVLKRMLKDVRKHRQMHRRRREGVPIPVVSLIGYTNAGKSTLMNALTDAGVVVEDKLFATLDPTVRKMKLASGREILIADTVGFIRKLPHQLVESFRATFEEVEASDLLLHIIDYSEQEVVHQVEVVEAVLKELGLEQKPVLKVFNKCDIDLPSPIPFPPVPVRRLFGGGEGKGGGRSEERVCISALKRTGLTELAGRLDEILAHGFKHTHLNLPITGGKILSELYRIGRVNNVRHNKSGILVDAELPEKLVGRYKDFCI